MDTLISKHREGFGAGYTPITTAGEAGDVTGISMAVLQLRAGESHVETLSGETAWLLMEGRVSGQVGGLSFELARNSLFDDSPACLHAAAGTPVEIRAKADAELTVYGCENPATFVPRVFRPGDVPTSIAAKDRSEGGACASCARSSTRATPLPGSSSCSARS